MLKNLRFLNDLSKIQCRMLIHLNLKCSKIFSFLKSYFFLFLRFSVLTVTFPTTECTGHLIFILLIISSFYELYKISYWLHTSKSTAGLYRPIYDYQCIKWPVRFKYFRELYNKLMQCFQNLTKTLNLGLPGHL